MILSYFAKNNSFISRFIKFYYNNQKLKLGILLMNRRIIIRKNQIDRFIKISKRLLILTFTIYLMNLTVIYLF